MVFHDKNLDVVVVVVTLTNLLQRCTQNLDTSKTVKSRRSQCRIGYIEGWLGRSHGPWGRKTDNGERLMSICEATKPQEHTEVDLAHDAHPS